MTQRLKHCPNTLNLETIACEKYISRILQREKSVAPTAKQTTTSITAQKNKERVIKSPVTSANQNQISKARSSVKQQNLPSPKLNRSSTRSVLQYADDSALIEVTNKSSHRQRSRSTVASVIEREPWGQLLKQHRSSDKVSLFNNFDPLRTLHFLAKELQYQLQAILPEDSTVQQMVSDMQSALKRVPPEVASTIHLQQAIDLLPSKKSSRSLDDEKPERLTPNFVDKVTQTPPCKQEEEYQKVQKVMEESTVKLEASCRQMEMLCGQLKEEKESLEKQLKTERDSMVFLKRRIEDLEFENSEILNHKIRNLEDEKQKLESDLHQLTLKLDAQSVTAANSKAVVEQECSKLKHQLRLCAIEKEKYIAVLAVRDRQISEIRNEMTQLQEVVNDQLMDLHNNAFSGMPTSATHIVNPLWNADHNKENVGDIGDGTLSSVHTDVDPVQSYRIANPRLNLSFRDIPSGDNCPSNILKELPKNAGHPMKDHKSQHNRFADSPQFFSRPDSQDNIRNMVSDIKKAAYSVGNSHEKRNQLN